MAKKMNTKASLKISTEEAVKQLKDLIDEFKKVKKNLEGDSNAIKVKLTLDQTSLKSLKAQLKKAFSDVTVTLPTVANTKNNSDTSKDLKKAAQEAKNATTEITRYDRQLNSTLNTLFSKTGQNIKSTTTFGVAQYQQLLAQIAKADAAAQSFRNSLNFNYPGGATKFDLDVDKLSSDATNRFLSGESLPILAQTYELVKKTGDELGEWDEILEGEVIDEFGNLRRVARETNEVIIGGMEDNSDKAKKWGKTLNTVESQIKKLGTAIKQVGNAWASFSTKTFSAIMTIGRAGTQVLSLLGTAPQEAMSGAIDQIKQLEYAEIGLQNQFSRKELGFNVKEYLEEIKELAKTTSGVGAGDLADYTNQLAPIADNSDQALNVVMGLLKTISAGGGDPSQEMGYMIKNMRDVLAKGKAYAMDINQFNRAAPILRDVLADMGLDQFIENDQLSITEDNVDQVMDAFAKLNSKDNPYYDILEQMNDTLGGAMEEASETMEQSIANALDKSGLLDTWKSILKNDEIWKYIDELLLSGATSLKKFLDQIDGAKVFEAVKTSISKIGETIKETLLPSIKKALGLDENAGLTDVIVSIIENLTKFGQGMIEGLSYIFGTVIPKLKEIIEWVADKLKSFGIEGDDVIKMIGWLAGTGWALGKAFGSLGNVIAKFVAWVVKLIGKGVINYATTGSILGSGSGSGIISTIGQALGSTKVGQTVGGVVSKAGSAITGGLSTLKGSAVTGSTILGGLGITAAGHLLSDSVSDWVSQGNSYVKDVSKNLVDLGSTFIGVTTVAGPLAGILLTLGEAAVKGYQALEEYADTVKAAREQTRENSLDELQKNYVQTVKDSLRAAGLFEYENADAEDALVEMMAAAESISASDDPTEVLERLKNVYMERYSRNLAATDVEEFLARITDKSSSDYIRGATKVTSDYANSEEGTAKLKAIHQALVELGMVAPESRDNIVSDYKGSELLAWLKRNDYEINTVEQLNAIADKLGVATGTDRPNTISKGDNLAYGKNVYDNDGNFVEFKEFENIEALMNSLGFTQGPEGSWVTNAEFKAELDEGAAEGLRAQLKDSLTVPGLLDEDGNLIITPVLNTDQKTKDDFKQDLMSVMNPVIENGQIKSWEWKGAPYKTQAQIIEEWKKKQSASTFPAQGGFIKPIFRAGGGGSKAARGSDTIPAMLSPGEFVQKASAVQTAGLGVMYALNHGDLKSAYKLLGAKIGGTRQTYNNSNVSNTSNKNQTNHVTIINKIRSARATAYNGLANQMAIY